MTAPVSEMIAIEEIAANDYLAASVYRAALQQLLRLHTELLAARRENDSLLRKFAEVERDAARYRFLREQGTSTTFPRVYDQNHEAIMWLALDAAIDSAMPGEG